eukprot:COSAG05_NODE_2444_length_3058_cov_13.939500_2_plen_65_part_00
MSNAFRCLLQALFLAVCRGILTALYYARWVRSDLIKHRFKYALSKAKLTAVVSALVAQIDSADA